MKGNINYEAFINFDCCKKSNYYSIYKNNHNQKQQQIIHTILEQNPPVGNRNRYLTDIFNLLVNEGLSKKSIDTLSRYGIILNHTGKHPTTTFFNDSRYTMTFSSTPSDLNVGRQYYRQIRKLFF